MDINIIILSLSLALQISGALLLIINYWGNTEELIIQTYFPGNKIVSQDSNGDVLLEKEKLRKCAETVYSNRVSFLYILIGYIINIWGNSESINRIHLAFAIVIWGIILLFSGKALPRFIAKCKYRKDRFEPYENIEKNVDRAITEGEVDSLF